MIKWNTELFSNYVSDNEGYELLSEYVGTNKKVTIKHHECGNVYEVTPNNFINAGRRCPRCAILKHNREIADKRKNRITNDTIKDKIKKSYDNNYKLLSDYSSSSKPLKFKHKVCDSEFECTWNSFLSKTEPCPECRRLEAEKKKIDSIDKLRLAVIDVLGGDYEVIKAQPFINKTTKVKILHKKCNTIFKETPNNLLKGCGCEECNKAQSVLNENPEDFMVATDTSIYVNELYNYLKKDLKLNVVKNDSKTIKGYTIDIMMTNNDGKKVGIVINGLYTNNELFVNRNFNLERLEAAEENNIKLIQMYEDEWVNKKDIVKRKLKYSSLNVGEKVFARKCYIKEIEADIKGEFLNRNHIQGTDTSNIKLGLFYPVVPNEQNENDKLVAVMTFCKPRLSLGQKKNKNGFDYELSRYATEGDICVVGGFSKLFKYFENNYEWNKLITYADKRWSDGNLYLKNGFDLDHVSKPSYSYMKPDNIERYNRFRYRKQRLKSLFPDIYEDSKTEFKIMSEAGYYKLFDCGNFVFYYTKNKEEE